MQQPVDRKKIVYKHFTSKVELEPVISQFQNKFS